MNPDIPRQITLDEWDLLYEKLKASGMQESFYGGPLRRHVEDGDRRLLHLKFDNSASSLRLWNFLLTEEERLHQARKEGKKIVGTMKDLGTIPVLAYSFSNVVAFYPDGAWWIPCVMEMNAGLLSVADSLGIDESFCPVRAMLGAFITEEHFPIPDLLLCSVGATCDDFSAIAQRLDGLGFPVFWWEVPHRYEPSENDLCVLLPGGFKTEAGYLEFVMSELERVRETLQNLTGQILDEERLTDGIRQANKVRKVLASLRREVYTAEICPIPALEMQIAEMLAIHFCSDRAESLAVLEDLLAEARRRIEAKQEVLPSGAVRVFWVNPVADLRIMNLLEECGGRICGTDYMFSHALDEIPEDLPPMEALARMVLADPMVGSTQERAKRIMRDVKTFGAEAVVISRIPGASHCATEGVLLKEILTSSIDIPVLEIEVPSNVDAMIPSLRTRLEALIETAWRRSSR